MKFSLPKSKNKSNKERFSVGLDIGTSTIKFVKLKFSNGNIELCGFALEPVSLDISGILKKIFQPFDSKIANVSVSGQQTIIRNVNFPKMNNEELKQALKFEAQKHIPFPVEEVSLDCHVLKPDLPDAKMMVLLAAVKKNFLNQRLKILEDSGITVNIVDIDSLSVINAFNFNYPQENEKEKQKTVALLNIGAAQSNLSILENSIPSLSRDINFAGNNFTQKLADAFGLDFKAGEILKLNPDKEKAEKIKSMIEGALTALATEIRVSFDYYESQNASSVGKIFLSGGGSLILGLKEMLAGMLDIEVEYWDVLSKISIPGNPDLQKAKDLTKQLVVAMGLALRN